MKDKNIYTESAKEFQEQFKGLTFDKIENTFREFKKDNEKEMRLGKVGAFGGIPINISPFVPKGEIWCINNKQEVCRIINVGNSKLYRFINWYQKLFKKISSIIIRINGTAKF